MGSIFGTTDELLDFAKIFGGTLFLAGLYFAARHLRGGIALPGVARFDWTVLALGLWCFTGLIVDAWAHKHTNIEDSFFTPWHAIWYSGFTAFAGYIIFALWRLNDAGIPTNLAAIKQFLANMPPGYKVGVLGMLVFAGSGFGDMLWHTFFGIEGGTDILLSPTHLGLAAGLTLSLMTPVIAAWKNPDSGKDGLSSQIVILFGIAAAFSVISLFTSFAHHQTLPFNSICAVQNSCADDNIGLELGITAIVLQSLLLTGMILFFCKRWQPVFGSFTIILTINGIALAAFAPGEVNQAWKHLITPIIAGLVIDLAYSKWGNRARLFAFTVPALHTLVWMAVMTIFTGFDFVKVKGDLVMSPLGWSIHATVGAIFLAGCMGFLVSLLADPPEVPDIDEL
jgi:hypothetical protein